MVNYEAFVYKWTNIENGMMYIGSHKGTIDDGYISSSKYLLEDYHKQSSNFIREIVAYGTVDDMRLLESSLLQEVDAAKNYSYYNKHNQTGKFICNGHSEETKEKMKKRVPWNKGKKGIYTEETLSKMQNAKIDYKPWNVGVSPSEETKKKLSEYKADKHHLFGKKRPELSEKMKGKKHSEETKEKMKLAWEKRRLNK